jgi:hypothetical protein
MTMQQLPAIAARVDPLVETVQLFTVLSPSSAVQNSWTVHSALSHPAAQYKTAPSGRGEELFPAADSYSSAAQIAAHACGNMPIWTSALLTALLKTARGKGRRSADCFI